jgi:membrane-associated PAP2 superfamily phosphatase
MHRTGLLVALVIAAAVGFVFAIRPDLDLKLAGLFFDPERGGFWRDTDPPYMYARDAARWLIALIALPAVVALVLRLVRPRWSFPVSIRGAALMLITLALVPWLMANVVFKDHWGRPRPFYVTEFGGSEHFRPWWDPRGNCPKNCSFVAGEPSGAFWTLAPAFRRRRRAAAHGGGRAFLHRRGVCRGVRIPGDLGRARIAVSLAATKQDQQRVLAGLEPASPVQSGERSRRCAAQGRA